MGLSQGSTILSLERTVERTVGHNLVFETRTIRIRKFTNFYEMVINAPAISLSLNNKLLEIGEAKTSSFVIVVLFFCF